MCLSEMSISKVFTTTGITAIVIAIATLMTAATFLNVAVFATLIGSSPELVGNDTTTNTTTPPTAEQQQQQQQTIHITKHSTNSYVTSGGSTSVGSFDTIYRIAGERGAIRASEDLIISTITSDFSSSRTIGYITPGGTTTTGATQPTLPSPFASHEEITERITSELRRVITEAENNTPQGQYVEINCNFGMTLEDMRCHYVPLPLVGTGGGGAGALATEAPTAPTNDTGTTTADTTAPIAPLEGQ
jgi:hypothetical protein